MQALKQAAREGDQIRLDALCEAWQVSAASGEREPARSVPENMVKAGKDDTRIPEKIEDAAAIADSLETRR
jgi:hypothetical protein